MPSPRIESGYVLIDNAKIYYQVAGRGTPLIMIHAGVADSRQWKNEFAHFSKSYRVLRYDMRGYGKSEPVEGDFSNLKDLLSVLEYLGFNERLILMGCSMGGGLAMDFALEYPTKVKALIMIGSGPGGLELDVEESPKFPLAMKAFEDGDLDQVAEIETQIWFDGEGRSPEHVDQDMRKLLFQMNRTVLEHEVKDLGKCLPNTEKPAFSRVSELKVPLLVIVGSHDEPYMFAAADFMMENIKTAQKVIMADAAHIPNMEHPLEFQRIVDDFLENI